MHLQCFLPMCYMRVGTKQAHIICDDPLPNIVYIVILMRERQTDRHVPTLRSAGSCADKRLCLQHYYFGC